MAHLERLERFEDRHGRFGRFHATPLSAVRNPATARFSPDSLGDSLQIMMNQEVLANHELNDLNDLFFRSVRRASVFVVSPVTRAAPALADSGSGR
jgi:hypothetical protein